MPNLPISGLPVSDALTGTELFATVQDSVTKYTTLNDITSFSTGSVMITGSISGPTLTFTKGDGSTFDLSLIGSGFPISYGLFSQTGSSIPVTGSVAVVSTSGSLLDGGVGTLTVPANSFVKGDSFQAVLSGKINIANNHTLDIQFKADGNTLVDTGVIVMPLSEDKNWNLSITFVIQEIGSVGTASILSSGLLSLRKNASGEVVNEIFSYQNNTTFDTTINNTLNIIGILGSACQPDEYIYSEIFLLNKTF